MDKFKTRLSRIRGKQLEIHNRCNEDDDEYIECISDILTTAESYYDTHNYLSHVQMCWLLLIEDALDNFLSEAS